MKICIAQIRPKSGQIDYNINLHIKWIQNAISKQADLIIFPELSLTGYEPKLAKDLATSPYDSRLDVFQEISDKNHIRIGIGLPIQSDNGIFISQLFFIPNKERIIYSKQHLHTDELPYFINGQQQQLLYLNSFTLAPAICYESLKLEHAQQAKVLGTTFYLASVAKPEQGIQNALNHFPKMAKQFSMYILMANSIGYSDNFTSAGQSAIWDTNGILIDQLDKTNEGLLLLNLSACLSELVF